MSKTQDEGARGREDYLNNIGWDWVFIKPNPPQPKQFFYKHMQLLRPSITVHHE
jgi:hypothetical protein